MHLTQALQQSKLRRKKRRFLIRYDKIFIYIYLLNISTVKEILIKVILKRKT